MFLPAVSKSITMPGNTRRRSALAALGLLFLAACGESGIGNPKTARNAEVSGACITVSILPQNYFVGRIAGERVRIMTLTGPGQNPHDYEPGPRQMAALARSGAWILSGAEFEISLRPKIEALFPDLIIVDGTAGVHFRMLEEHDDHDGHGDDELDEPGRDRHTWLGSEGAKIMAGHLLETLIALDESAVACTENPAAGRTGGNRAFYTANYDALIRDIDGEFERLRDELAPLRGSVVFVYHPAFGYFLDEFGITQAAVENGGKEPTPRFLARLIGEAKREKPAAIFVQAQFPLEAARTVARAAGAALIPLDPLAPDWLENIREMGRALERAGRFP
ncbi:zinc ABC transporter substrate-binding protein [Spirochaetia bacterium]|nr:zinc ABC transporter substrate-binding protein [Spirochaetia bacterium]